MSAISELKLSQIIILKKIKVFWYILKQHQVTVCIEVSCAAVTLGNCGRREMLIFLEASSSLISSLDTVLSGQLFTPLSKNGSMNVQRGLDGVMCVGDTNSCLQCFLCWMEKKKWIGRCIACSKEEDSQEFVAYKSITCVFI